MRAFLHDWLALLRPGDYFLIVLASLLIAASFPWFWQGGSAERAIIRQDSQIFAEVDLRATRQIEVSGPLGLTQIAIEPGRVRVLADPGPRQYCVRQGWLMRPGEIAVCAPNRVSVQIVGRTKVYDALSY